MTGSYQDIASSTNQNGNQRNESPRVYIIHGYNASPSDHWFPWLHKELSRIGVEAVVLNMPDSSNPEPEEWLVYLELEIQEIDKNTFFVAHSLGCVSLLKYLNSLEHNTEIGGMVLVSGFVSPLENIPELNGFVEDALDFNTLISASENRIVIGAIDDPIVSYVHTKELSKALRAELHQLEEGGHFLGMNGYTKLPVVLEALKKMIH